MIIKNIILISIFSTFLLADTINKIELGKLLFFDKRLSKSEKISCATCHQPKKGWAEIGRASCRERVSSPV